MEKVANSSSSTMTISHCLITQAALVKEQQEAFICTWHTCYLFLPTHQQGPTPEPQSREGSDTQIWYRGTSVLTQTDTLHKFIQTLGQLLACVTTKQQETLQISVEVLADVHPNTLFLVIYHEQATRMYTINIYK